ncbi:hypothetical protein M406DRAFT_252710 [Cryphonectria parasitica EP155]|uniref:Nucleoside 2-deoxyribosyltransferase domain-containing protein n=1 Tax=Cryphonectria parasitica (strain ATCC 38755 / EP155) TaxID=660469 RepID=A0A9P5CRG5_CRYP1|nr:uncharacterized protein M406DRAFT_252710 [Cryphonectria parasitica EP155]KAF3767507.1 hypothetical protein M406DRAFT_252710 [Cryphonectria parasitica EP155]
MASSPVPSSPKIQIITPNTPSQTPLHPTTIFLAGPTEFPWRQDFLAHLKSRLLDHDDLPPDPITIYNPFQEKWDKTWKEDYHHDDRFRAQTDWEMDRIDSSSHVVVFFVAESKAPVSLLELGLCVRSGRAVVGCEGGFWKRGNVQAACQRLDVPLEDTLEGLVGRVVEILKKKKKKKKEKN